MTPIKRFFAATLMLAVIGCSVDPLSLSDFATALDGAIRAVDRLSCGYPASEYSLIPGYGIERGGGIIRVKSLSEVLRNVCKDEEISRLTVGNGTGYLFSQVSLRCNWVTLIVIVANNCLRNSIGTRIR